MIIPTIKYQKCFLITICLFVLMAITFVPIPLKAQDEKQDFKKIDSLTFALYQQQKWDELIDVGSSALKHGNDYFYLRMRIGIAWYEKQNYRQAIPHFERALKFNEMDQSVMEYLYYCYLLSGRQYDVRGLIPELNERTKEKIGIRESGIFEEIYFEGGPGWGANQQIKDDWGQSDVRDTIYNSAYFYDNYTYFHAGARLKIHQNISTYQGYGYVQAPFTQKSRYLNQPAEDFTYTTHQNEYYGNVTIGLPSGIKIIPAWHFIWYKYDHVNTHYDTTSFELISDTVKSNISNYVMSLSIKKDLPYFALELNGTYGDFSKYNQAQLGISGYTYPFGNLNLYTQTSLINRWQDNDYSLIFYQMVGGRLTKSFWLESNFTIGDLTNYAENNAFVIYNSPEKINYKFEATLIYRLNKHLEFSLMYRLLQRESEYLYYVTIDDYERSSVKYLYHTFIGGIKWMF